MIIDLHEDIGTALGDPNFKTHGQVDLNQLRESDVRLVLTTNYWRTPEEARIKDEEVVREYKKRMKNNEKFVRNKEDLNNLAGEGVNLLLVQEGFITPEPSNPSEANDRLRELWNLGVRILQPVYKGNEKQEGTSPIGTSAFDPVSVGNEKGLTKLGKDICYTWIQKGGTIDASHSSPQTLRDIVKICKEEESPLLISHTGIEIHGEYPRCLRADQLEFLNLELEDIDFLIGLGVGNLFFNKFSKTASTLIMIGWAYGVDRVGQIVGFDHVGIGSDIGGAISGLIGNYEKAEDIFPDMIKELREDFKEQKVQKITFRNAKRFLRKALPRE